MNDKQAYEALWADDAARALTTANEKYKRVARIERRVTWSNGLAVYVVYRSDGYLHDTSLHTKRMQKSNERMDRTRAANVVERAKTQVSLYLEFPEMVGLLAELERVEHALRGIK